MSALKMKKTYRGSIRVDVVKSTIYVSKSFRKACANIESDEYTLLQLVKEDNPTFKVEERTITKNANKESYRGLTYAYMEQYIALHDGAESKRMTEFRELKHISQCHSIRFPKIRAWFLETYPDVKNFTVEHLYDNTNSMQVGNVVNNHEPPIAA